jgi:hypothetical protein
VSNKIDSEKFDVISLLDDLKKVNELLWLYELAIAMGHDVSDDGKIDYVEHRDKMLNVKFKILNLLAAKGEEKYVQLCK